MGIYQSIQNPLTEENLDKVVRYYAGNHTMYNSLTRNHVSEKVVGQYYPSETNAFYVRIFKEWRKAILIQANRDDLPVDALNKYRTVYLYIKDKNPKTKQEVIDLLDYEEMKECPLRNALKQVRFNSIGEYSGWDHFHSNFIHYGLSEEIGVKHRLYLNLDSTIIHTFMNLFITKCNHLNLPFYFKLDDYGSRDDSVVIYSDVKNLEKYVKILREIKNELKVDQSIHNPPIMTGKIDGWIGYGSEPQKSGQSFNDTREKHIEKCVLTVGNEWMRRNLGVVFTHNGRTMSYKDFVINTIVNEAMEYFKRFARDDDNHLQVRGYQKKDLTNDIIPILRNYISNHFNEIMEYYSNPQKKPELKMPFRYGYLDVNTYILDYAFKKQLLFMLDNSKRFKRDLLDRIKNTASSYGIDPNNYSCDLYVLAELKKDDSYGVKNVETSSKIKNEPYVSTRQSKTGDYNYKPMTDAEIEEARRRLGIRI